MKLITAEQLLIDLAALEIHTNLVALQLAGNVPEHRQDLQRLAEGQTFVRPTEYPPLASATATGAAQIDAALGLLGINAATGTEGPAPATAGMEPGSNGAPAPNAMVPTASAPSEPNAALNAIPWEARNLMNEPMVQHKLSRHGPVTVEVSAALTALDCGAELTRVWNEHDNYVTTIVENDRERLVERANDLADRMLRGPSGPGQTLSIRENGMRTTAPFLSVLLPGTRSGGTTARRFDHPDQRSNGPMS